MIKMIKKAAMLTIVVLLGIVAYFAPHRAFHKMREAADQRDGKTLSASINYDQVRESLKRGVQDKALGQVGDGSNFNPLRALGAVVTASMADPVIERLVTPENLSRLMRGQAPETGDEGNREPEGIVPAVARDFHMRYLDANTFVVRPKATGPNTPEVEFRLGREGIWSWKLWEIRLP